jgi:hypothetical protein
MGTTMSFEFEPRLSDRLAMLVAGQRWRDGAGKEWFGVALAKALWSQGVIAGVETMVDTPVGGTIDDYVRTE